MSTTVNTPRKPPRENELQVTRTGAWMTMGVLTLAAVYFLVPVWWLIVSATKSNTALFNSNGFVFSGQNLTHNVHDVLTRQDGLFVRWLVNSLLYAGVGGAWPRSSGWPAVTPSPSTTSAAGGCCSAGSWPAC